MMLSISYLLYSVHYLVCLLITTKTIRLENICMLVWDLRFTITTLVLGLHPGVRCLLSINPRLPCLTPRPCIIPQSGKGQ